MRLDRIATLYLARPLLASGLMSRGRMLPILMYHSISDDPQPGVAPYYKTTTSPVAFENQLRQLSRAGYKSVCLGAAMSLMKAGRELPDKTVVITFDDGFRDFYDLAFPVLKRHGHTASMFLSTAFIGNERRSFKGRECLVWNEVRELRDAGIEFGSHTVNHPKLYELRWREIEAELAVSKDRIERELQEPVASFSYPFAFPQHDGQFMAKFSSLLQTFGYESCATTIIGTVRAGDNPLCLKRLPVNSCDDQALLDAKLRGAYDWLARVQGWYKSLRHRPTRTAVETTQSASRPQPN
jgi:peptidoglycan/xylan/chitin deacetylase (PgdA/CDA1 family)